MEVNDSVRKIYIKSDSNSNLVEIQPEYVYMRIPAEYVCLYHKILIQFADFGVELLDDCQSSCKDVNKNLITCFNMFNAAVAARKLGNIKLANTLIKYIEAQLNIKYNGDIPCPEIVYPVDEEGKINAIVGCSEKPKFYVDAETGKLWEEHSDEMKTVYSLGENDTAID